MDVLILSSRKNAERVKELSSRLQHVGVDSTAQLVDDSWGSQHSADLLHLLRTHAHTVFVTEAPAQAPGLLLAAGFCAARRGRALTWRLDADKTDPFWQTVFPVADSLDTLLTQLLAERDAWLTELARREAWDQLVERGFEVTNSAFWETVEKGDTSSVDLFLRAGFQADSVNKKGVTMLCLAVRFSHLTVLRLLLARGADINRKSTDRDNTPLMDAAAEGHVEMVQELVALGADLAGQSRNGQNALVLAIGKGADAVARVLLDAGADPFADDKLGMSALKYAQLFGRRDVLEHVARLYPDRA